MKEYQVDAVNFDGAKFAKRYNLDVMADFSAVYKDGLMFVVIPDAVVLPDEPPIFEAPDTSARDELETLNAKLSSGDLTLAEVNTLLRKERRL